MEILSTEILGRNFLKPAVNSRKPTPIEQAPPEPPISEEELQRQQELLLEYVRQAVTLENVNRFAGQVLNHRETVSALELASTQSQEFIKIIGLHTYSQSPDRNYEISEQEEMGLLRWVPIPAVLDTQAKLKERFLWT